jgi:hypothetical protein
VVEFPCRTHEEHKSNAELYKNMCVGKERDALFKRTGSRYAEVLRLPYFDSIVMSIIDPMHNILLGEHPGPRGGPCDVFMVFLSPGICKTQWLECWIHGLALRRRTEKLPRELDQLHSYMKKVMCSSNSRTVLWNLTRECYAFEDGDAGVGGTSASEYRLPRWRLSVR